jgi:[acyl-carrier-protein] S-malonyltransferase|tara:strand:+ start:201172 stop:202113 length:942 start_codon:yes stop_codon:yes gene_type:complete
MSSRNTAFVFPGQGSQSLGMLRDLAEQHPLVLDAFSTVSGAVNYDVWALIQTDAEQQLNQTEFTQVAMLAADVAIYRVLQAHHIHADISAGHSLGEYAALVCADALDLADASRLVQARGQIMQQTVPLGAGAMAAIVGLTDEQVQELCQEASTDTHVVSPANYNAIGQVVIAGHTDAVRQAMILAEAKQARLAKEIPVSVPCHCALLRDAATKFQEILEKTTFRAPKRAVISNVDLSTHTTSENMRRLLAEQLYKPVRWVETVQAMKQAGVTQIIECGPGSVLAGLTKRIDRTIPAMSVNNPAHLSKVLALKE